MRYHLLAWSLLVAAVHAYAATGVVEGVRMPIWVEQDGAISALAPGARLRTTDAVVTGEGGRLLLKLDDGSLVRLGENAKLVLDDLKSGQGTAHTAISVKQGSFRFKSGGAKKTVNVMAGSLSASSGRLDIWGNVGEERDVLALLAKGRVKVEHDNGSNAVLARANTFVDTLDGGTLSPVTKVAASDYRRWIAQTDLQTGKGVATRKGRWIVDLGAFRERAEAAAIAQDVAKEGYAVVAVPANVQGKTYWRPQISRFKTSNDAAVVAEQLRNQFDTLSITTRRK